MIMKERLDILVVKSGLASSREKAKAMIMEGIVLVDGQREDKPGSTFQDSCVISLKGKPLKYVSRGGLKLEKAMQSFGIALNEKVCMDIGSSTGGFTDCMLQNGAKKVYSVDVGYGQLDWKLRNDSRVVCMEKTNARYLTKEDIQELPEFVSVDVSFISLTKILNVVYDLLVPGGSAAVLIKPQFEAGKEKVGKKGVVREPEIHEEVIKNVLGFAAVTGFKIRGLDFSPVKGPEGNIEYLAYLEKNGECQAEQIDVQNGEWKEIIRKTVSASHESLDK